MTELFTAEYQWLWILVLTLGLFIPVRNLIIALATKRAIAKSGELDEAGITLIRKRASMTSVLLTFVFSFFYTNTLF